MNTPPEHARRTPPEALSREQFLMFRNYLYQMSGVFVPEDQKVILEHRVARRMAALGIDSPIEYMNLIRNAHRRELGSELFHFLDALTTHETSFFRTGPQFVVLQYRILPELLDDLRRKNAYHLKIWSAACSTGEEAYSLAMVVRETLGSEARRWNVEILGTDISPAVIHKAREGVYGENTMRNLPVYYRHKYFNRNGGEYAIVSDIAHTVHFRVLNFNDDMGMRGVTGQHLIFCRNAFIYFDLEAKRRFARHFHDSLTDGGYLVIGHSETLHGVEAQFTPIQFKEAVVYRKDREGPAEGHRRPW